MKTKGDEINAACDRTLVALEPLKFGAYTSADISALIEPLSSRIELFLKTTVFPTASGRTNFYTLIEDLKAAGIRPDHIAKLHSMRDLYNESKHQPGAVLDLMTATRVVKDAQAALDEVCRAGLGLTGSLLEKEARYHLWVGFWDSYTGGYTTVAIMLPGTHWTHVSAVDTMYIKITDWDDLKAELALYPRFHLGEEHFAPAVWKSFYGDSDFLNAGVWDGSYSEIVAILARYAYREIEHKFLPGMARKDNYISVGTSVIAAALDIARSAAAPISAEDLVRQALTRADAEYAVTAAAPHVREAAEQVGQIIESVPFDEWKVLAGPFLVLRRKRPADEQQSVSGPLDVVLEERQILLRHSDEVIVSVTTFDK